MSEHNLKPLSQVMEDLKKEGYEKEFAYTKGKLYELGNNANTFGKDELEIIEEYRFEGDSDPGMMSILYALKTKNGDKGMISNGYGKNADTDLAEFMKEVKHI